MAASYSSLLGCLLLHNKKAERFVLDILLCKLTKMHQIRTLKDLKTLDIECGLACLHLVFQTQTSLWNITLKCMCFKTRNVELKLIGEDSPVQKFRMKR